MNYIFLYILFTIYTFYWYFLQVLFITNFLVVKFYNFYYFLHFFCILNFLDNDEDEICADLHTDGAVETGKIWLIILSEKEIFLLSFCCLVVSCNYFIVII